VIGGSVTTVDATSLVPVGSGEFLAAKAIA